MRHRFYAIAILLLLFSAGGVAFTQTAAAPAPQPAASSHKTAENPADYVGADSCALCHQAEVNGFPKGPHAKLELEHGGNGVTCESCHGPGRAHVESGGDKTKIFDFKTAPAKDVDQHCIGCHLDTHANSERSSHAEAGVSCTSCHSTHAFTTETGMLKDPEPKLCYSCHTDVKASFSEPFHHKVNEGVMGCNDCHDPHGTFNDHQLQKSPAQDAVCTKCHTETAGPFVYEHPPVKLEGCTSCHTPHGSQNARLLTRNNENSLCLQCHSASINFTAPGTPSFHNQANQYQSCTTCHTQVHGSNADPYFFK
jgi:DmsE family decaheme c-type cytochrome